MMLTEVLECWRNKTLTAGLQCIRAEAVKKQENLSPPSSTTLLYLFLLSDISYHSHTVSINSKLFFFAITLKIVQRFPSNVARRYSNECWTMCFKIIHFSSCMYTSHLVMSRETKIWQNSVTSCDFHTAATYQVTGRVSRSGLKHEITDHA